MIANRDTTAESPEISNKKGNAGGSLPALGVSVSFGRFENDDSLYWERWSSFSSNRYLEEVEKCSTPGSVASKKAYFEAHYKRMAPQKAELSDQEKLMTASAGTLLGVQNSGDMSMRSNASFGSEGECDAAEQDTDEAFMAGDIFVAEPNGDVVITQECPSTWVEREDEEELDIGADNIKLKRLNEFSLLTEKSPSVGSQGVAEPPPWDVEIEMPSTPKVEAEKVSLGPPKASPKITLPNERGNSAATVVTKSASPMPKSPQISVSTPGVSRPVSSSIAVSASKSSVRKGHGSPLPKSSSSYAHESKRAVHRNLQRPLASGRANFAVSGPLPGIRKSIIMENMCDKEIVRRAFRTFQIDFSHLQISGEERSSAKKKATTKVAESRVSTFGHSQKDNEGSFKAGGMNQIIGNKGGTSSFVLRLDVRAEKRKEFFKKLEEKSNAKKVEELHRMSKIKEEQAAEIKKLRESLNFKARPMPNFYRRVKPSNSDKSTFGCC